MWGTIRGLATAGWVLATRQRLSDRRKARMRQLIYRAVISARLEELERQRLEFQAAEQHPADGDVSLVVHAESDAEAAELIDIHQRAGGLVATGQMMRLRRP